MENNQYFQMLVLTPKYWLKQAMISLQEMAEKVFFFFFECYLLLIVIYYFISLLHWLHFLVTFVYCHDITINTGYT